MGFGAFDSIYLLKEFHGSYEDWRTKLSTTPVRIQWDPERDLNLKRIIGKRSIQIGLSGVAVEKYVSDWIKGIVDVTPIAKSILSGKFDESKPTPDRLEREYPLSDHLRELIAATH